MSNLPSGADLDAHQADETARAATAGPGWTPGPWKVYESDLNTFTHPGVDSARVDFSVVIGGAGVDDGGVDGRTDAEKFANARLIAAAPDLYEALDGLANSLRVREGSKLITVNHDELMVLIPAARAALRKARNQ